MQIELNISPINEVAKIQPPRAVTAKIETTEGKLPEIKTKPLQKEDDGDVESNLKELQAAFSEHNMSLKFSRDKETNALVVELINQQTGEAVRQIPSEVSLKLAAEMGKLQGLIYSRKA